MNGTDPSGYLFRGEIFCSTCIRDLFVEIPTDVRLGTEEVLDRAATQRGINRHNEQSFGSRQFPMPLYLDDVTGADICFFCGTPLVDQAA